MRPSHSQTWSIVGRSRGSSFLQAAMSLIISSGASLPATISSTTMALDGFCRVQTCNMTGFNQLFCLCTSCTDMDWNAKLTTSRTWKALQTLYRWHWNAHALWSVCNGAANTRDTADATRQSSHKGSLLTQRRTSQKIVDKENRSLARPKVPRRMSSGAIQMKLPIWVAVFAVGPFTSLPRPKSAILTFLSDVMSKFGVFISKCATPCSCNQERPAVTATIASLPLQLDLINDFEAHTSSAVTALHYLSNAWSSIWA